MLENVAEVAKRAATLLDDPSQSTYSTDYLMPWIDQKYEDLDVMLEECGMQYVESIAIFDIASGVGDLSDRMAIGGPLQYMKFPKDVWWKQVGQPNYLFQQSSGPVAQLIDVDEATSIGAIQWKNANGGIQITPSVVAMTMKIVYDRMSTNIVDPNTGTIRGTAHILAYMVAKGVAGARKGMEKRVVDLEKDKMASWNQFKNVLVKNKQSNQVEAQAMHGRRRMGTNSPRA